MMKKPSKDNWWYLATNFRNVAIGDFIWCYYGVADGDLGVVGVAKVEDIVHDEDNGAGGEEQACTKAHDALTT